MSSNRERAHRKAAGGRAASVAVEPILARVDRQREQVESQLRTAIESAEAALAKRADELIRVGDATVSVDGDTDGAGGAGRQSGQCRRTAGAAQDAT